jgi:hypothetical protein
MRVRFTIRWTAMDGLSHWVPRYAHTRLCDGAPIAGLNHEVKELPSCLFCTVTRANGRRY